MTEDRAAHLQLAKDRAHVYVRHGDLTGAIASMISDLKKHPAWSNDHHLLATLGMVGMMDAQSGNSAAVRSWIDGWN